METNDSPENEVVWLIDERTFAHLVKLGAHVSVVRYTRAGIDFEVVIENDEYIFREDPAIDHPE